MRPPASAHVTITSNGNMVGDSVMYQCYPGYTIVGHSNITCVDQPGFALWNDVYPRCILARKRSKCLFVCLFDLILYVPSTIFQLKRDGSSRVEPVLS